MQALEALRTCCLELGTIRGDVESISLAAVPPLRAAQTQLCRDTITEIAYFSEHTKVLNSFIIRGLHLKRSGNVFVLYSQCKHGQEEVSTVFGNFIDFSQMQHVILVFSFTKTTWFPGHCYIFLKDPGACLFFNRIN